MPVLLALLAWALGGCASAPRPPAVPLPALEALFRPASGWVGGDGAYSVALGEGRLLWLFGDSFIGRVAGGRRVGTVLVNNAAAVHAPAAVGGGVVRFFTGRGADGRPAALIEPADGRGWLWIFDGFRAPGGLFLFLVQLERTEPQAAFGFRVIGNWLARVPNPELAPDRWQVEQHRLPWHGGAAEASLLMGSAVLAGGDGFLYVYGTRDRPSPAGLRKPVFVARVPADDPLDFGRWRFFDGRGWSADFRRAQAVCEDAANEFSVSFLPRLGRYVMVYSRGGLSDELVARRAPTPLGPWGVPEVLYRCPEAGWDRRIFCYAGKGHPELPAGPGELVVTYVANATDIGLLEADARLYRPRFLRVRFGP